MLSRNKCQAAKPNVQVCHFLDLAASGRNPRRKAQGAGGMTLVGINFFDPEGNVENDV
jgi:hypothetical protein